MNSDGGLKSNAETPSARGRTSRGGGMVIKLGVDAEEHDKRSGTG